MGPEFEPSKVTKKSRSSGTRSRSGCHTCKVRRVKCDERKPGCLRCEKFGRPCDGYEIRKVCTSPGPRPNQGRPNREILPSTLAPLKLSSRQPITIIFQDEIESRYFRTFIDETSQALAGGFDIPLWNTIILQACNDEPCILQIAIALAALDKSCKIKNSKTLAHTYETHRRYALRQYSKALKSVQNVVSNRGHSLRTALIASLLIFCFENFHGDARLALTNVQRAVELMHKWLASNAGPCVPGFSPAPNTIDHEIVAAFARLDLHLTSWIETPEPTRINIQSYAVTEARPLPEEFHNLTEAKIHFDHVVNRVFHFLTTVQFLREQIKISLRNNGFDEHITALPEPSVAKELREWLRVFDPLLRRARIIEGDRDFVGTTLLRIHAILLKTSLDSVIYTQTSPYFHDMFLPEYSEIVFLSSQLVKHPLFVKSYVFDAGIVPCLFIVLTKCRDMMLRKQAIQILKDAAPRREGVWDAMMVARIGEEVIKHQEKEDRKREDSLEIHLQCLNVSLDLPKPKVGEERESLEKRAKCTSKGPGTVYLLDWVERCMKMTAVSENSPGPGS